MATAAAAARALPVVPGRRYDKVFFSSMAVLLLVIVLVGFGRTYFLKGLVLANLPSPIIHVHGAVFTIWTLLLLTQTTLVATGNVALHRKLGLWTFALSCAMPILGLAAAINSLSRGFHVPGLDAETFFAIPVFSIVIFSVLIFFAYRERLNSAVHKRLVLLATIELMGAPTGRPPFTAITGHPHTASVVVWALIAMLICYDLFALHTVNKATLLGGLWLVIMDQLSVPIGFTPAWHAFAHALQHVATRS